MEYHENLTKNIATTKATERAPKHPVIWYTKVENRGDQYVVSIMYRFNDTKNQGSDREEFKFAFGRSQLLKFFQRNRDNVFCLVNRHREIKQQIEDCKRYIDSRLSDMEYDDPRIPKSSSKNYHRAVERMKKVDCYIELQRMARSLAFMKMMNECHSYDEFCKIHTIST